MPVITKIKPQKNKKRVNIYLDGKFAFGLDLETFVKNNLKVEQELAHEEIEKIVKEGEFQSVYNKILRLASLRPRSQKEYEQWLRKHRVHMSLHEELFNKLKHLEFLDDKKFATWWVDQRVQFRNKSVRELKQELRLKGIDKDIVEEVITKSGIDELVQAKRLIEKRRYKWEKLEGFEARKKISVYLARKGYSWDVIRKVIDQFD